MSTIRLMSELAWDWGVRCFGADHMRNPNVRALRCAEESVELAQSLGVSRQQIIDLVDMIYSRPPGNPLQEMGGVLVTLSVLCNLVANRSIEEAFEIELKRCLSKTPDEFRKRNDEKNRLGFDGSKNVNPNNPSFYEPRL